MKKKGDHRPRNSAQYERVVELLIMHKAKWTPSQISLLYRRFHDQGRSSDSNEICLGVHFALCINFVNRAKLQKLVFTKSSFTRISIDGRLKIMSMYTQGSGLPGHNTIGMWQLSVINQELQ